MKRQLIVFSFPSLAKRFGCGVDIDKIRWKIQNRTSRNWRKSTSCTAPSSPKTGIQRGSQLKGSTHIYRSYMRRGISTRICTSLNFCHGVKRRAAKRKIGREKRRSMKGESERRSKTWCGAQAWTQNETTSVGARAARACVAHVFSPSLQHGSAGHWQGLDAACMYDAPATVAAVTRPTDVRARSPAPHRQLKASVCRSSSRRHSAPDFVCLSSSEWINSYQL